MENATRLSRSSVLLYLGDILTKDTQRETETERADKMDEIDQRHETSMPVTSMPRRAASSAKYHRAHPRSAALCIFPLRTEMWHSRAQGRRHSSRDNMCFAAPTTSS